MEQFRERLIRLLRAAGWKFREFEDGVTGYYGMPESLHISQPLPFVLFIDSSGVNHCTILFEHLEQGVLASVAEYSMRVNYILKNGSFDINYDGGELRFKCWLSADAIESMTDANAISQIDALMRLPYMVVGKFYAGFGEVVSGRKGPSAAFAASIGGQ